MEPVDPRALRISDAERHRVAELLREAAGEGRLDLEELDERLEATYAAKTYGDLLPLTLDLPGQADLLGPARAATVPARRDERTPVGTTPTYGASFALMSESRRSGSWDVGEHHVAVACMGSIVLDLREARFPQGEVVIDAYALMGRVQVLVNYRTAVVVSGLGVMGSYQEHRSRYPTRVDGSSPVVRVRGFALMGSVDVGRQETEVEERQRHEPGHELGHEPGHGG